MYVLINNGMVHEIIPEENPDFPGIPISARYEAGFVKKLMRVPDDVEVGLNWVWDGESGTFSPPPEPEPESDEVKAERLQAQITALESELTLTKSAIQKAKTL